jgi:lysophospholipase L1-like esterase
MVWFLVSVALLAACVLGAVGYAGWRLGRRPAGDPKAVLAAGGPPADAKVLVCLGDSITQGGIGTHWVGRLRQRLGEDAFVVNAGINGQVTWDLRQRLDAVARCRPTAVTLMVGTNDAVGSLSAEWAAYYRKNNKLPQEPTEAWYAEQYDALVAELVTITPRLVCVTLAPLGEDPTTPAEAALRRHNDVIRASAARHGAELLDLHPALLDLQARAGGSPSVPFVGPLSKLGPWLLGSAVGHYVLGRSWDRVAQGRGLVLTCDTIHLTERSGDVLLGLVEPWVRSALAATEDPVRRSDA